MNQIESMHMVSNWRDDGADEVPGIVGVTLAALAFTVAFLVVCIYGERVLSSRDVAAASTVKWTVSSIHHPAH